MPLKNCGDIYYTNNRLDLATELTLKTFAPRLRLPIISKTKKSKLLRDKQLNVIGKFFCLAAFNHQVPHVVINNYFGI